MSPNVAKKQQFTRILPDECTCYQFVGQSDKHVRLVRWLEGMKNASVTPKHKCTHTRTQATSLHKQAGGYIRQPPTSLCTTSNFLVYNLQLPHITPNFLVFAMIIMVATVMVVMFGHGGRGEHDGQYRTGQN